jgi:hypothetical protein
LIALFSLSPKIILSVLRVPDVLQQVMQCGRLLWWMIQMYLQTGL